MQWKRADSPPPKKFQLMPPMRGPSCHLVVFRGSNINSFCSQRSHDKYSCRLEKEFCSEAYEDTADGRFFLHVDNVPHELGAVTFLVDHYIKFLPHPPCLPEYFLSVLWMGQDAIPGSPETINALKRLGKKVFYVTNNSTKGRDEYLKKCLSLGFNAELGDIFPTSYCVAIYLKYLNFKKKVYVFGSTGITSELDKAGIEYLPIGPDPVPEDWINWVKELKLDPEVGAVVIGFDEHISYLKLTKAASYLKNPQCLFIVTNQDEKFPSGSDLIIPGTGTLVAAVQTASGRQPTSLGKPSKFMFDCIKQKHPELDPARSIMIGDKLSTDILLGTNNGLRTLLVLTGISSMEEVEKYQESNSEGDRLLVPDYYLNCLGELGNLLPV